MKGKIDPNISEDLRRLKDRDIKWIEILKSQGRIKKKFNTTLLVVVTPENQKWREF